MIELICHVKHQFKETNQQKRCMSLWKKLMIIYI